MINIPRRKIYEKMLEFEDILLEMQILLLNEDNFKKFKFKFLERVPDLREIYLDLKILFVLFLENKTFETESDYLNYVGSLKKNFKKVDEILLKNPNISKNLKEVLKKLNVDLFEFDNWDNMDEVKNIFELLDEFNSRIPKLLEIRRDEMMN